MICGLVGMAGNICSLDKKMFREMLILDQVRGLDSTGIALINNVKDEKTNRRFVVDKEVGPPSNLWDWGSSPILDHRGIIPGWPKIIIGHNRAATTGKIVAENAHPFIMGDIVGAHNGSLRVWNDLEGAKNYDVDSKAIFNDIDINGIEHTWKSFTGAAALVYWNDKEETLNFIRNDERPLVFAEGEKRNIMYWASESWMIQVAANRNGVKLHTDKDGKTIFRSCPEHILHTYKVTSTSFILKSSEKLEKKILAPASGAGAATSTGTIGKTGVPFLKEVLDKFKPNRKWKEHTSSCDIDAKGMFLTDFRWIRKPKTNTQDEENLFRLDMRDGNKFIAQLDIIPMNRSEVKKFLKVLEAMKAGSCYDIELIDNPRKEFNPFKSLVSRYRCTASSVKFKKTNVTVLSPPAEKEGRVYLNHKGQPVSKAVIVANLKDAGNCCCYCQGSIFLEDADSLSWVDSRSPLCGECSVNWGGNLHMLNSGR